MNNTYYLASDLRGFRSTALRVRLVRRDDRSRTVFVVTADLLDAGTHLALDASQVARLSPG